ncbi:MAG: beta-N-acetylhexosaminidase [Bacteriovoracia bacterium]
MTIDRVRQLLGQTFWIGFAGTSVPNSIRSFIEKNHIGGISLFANNYESPNQIAELNNKLQEINPSDFPLAIAVDHEGGKVQRFKNPFIHFPEPRVIGDKNSPKLAFDCARVMAEELKAVGCNVIYAPLADIHTNPANPVIGRRAFGENEEIVSKMVSAYIRGFITHGIQPVVKHFPGHGDTTEDSHFKLPKVSTDANTLHDRELKPFSRAFKSKCELVMTAHIIVEKLDAKNPATMSTKVLQDLLRSQMRYKGLIISDDMEMKAIADNFGDVDAALMAIEAGCDILLYHTEPFETKAFEGLMSALTSPRGKNALACLERSFDRITDWKKRHFAGYAPIPISEVEKIVGNAEFQDIYQKTIS